VISEAKEDTMLTDHPPGGFSSNQFKRGLIYLIVTLASSSGATLDVKLVFVGILIYYFGSTRI
jgi:hypothetical protein